MWDYDLWQSRWTGFLKGLTLGVKTGLIPGECMRVGAKAKRSGRVSHSGDG